MFININIEEIINSLISSGIILFISIVYTNKKMKNEKKERLQDKRYDNLLRYHEAIYKLRNDILSLDFYNCSDKEYVEVHADIIYYIAKINLLAKILKQKDLIINKEFNEKFKRIFTLKKKHHFYSHENVKQNVTVESVKKHIALEEAVDIFNASISEIDLYILLIEELIKKETSE